MHNEKERYKIITKTEIGQKLKKNVLKSIPATIVFMLLFIGIALLLYLIGLLIADIIATCLLVTFMSILIYYVVDSLILIVSINKGQLEVCEDTMKSIRQVRKRGTLYYVFSFESGKSYWETVKQINNLYAIGKDDTRLIFSLNHSNGGDVFYLVSLKKSPNKLLKIYHSAIFKYEER